MSKEFIQNHYIAGDVVFAKADPTLKLVIRRYYDEIYYCKIHDHPEKKELVYFERELIRDLLLEEKNQKAKKLT